MSRLAIITAVVAMSLVVPLHGQTAGTGRLAGRAINARGEVLPGVTVTLDGSGTAAVSGADGRFELEAFVESAKTYTVAAYLAGFETTRKNGVRVRPGVITTLGDVVLRLGCSEPDLVVDRGIVEVARESDLVAHVRVESLAPTREWRDDDGCTIASEVTASVLDATPGKEKARIRFLVPRRWVHQYEQGDEFVAAFTWNPTWRRYSNGNTRIPVLNGVATLDRFSLVAGLEAEMPVRSLLDRIVELTTRRDSGRSKDRPLP